MEAPTVFPLPSPPVTPPSSLLALSPCSEQWQVPSSTLSPVPCLSNSLPGTVIQSCGCKQCLSVFHRPPVCTSNFDLSHELSTQVCANSPLACLTGISDLTWPEQNSLCPYSQSTTTQLLLLLLLSLCPSQEMKLQLSQFLTASSLPAP